MQIGRLFHKKLQKNTRKILESIPKIRRGQTSTQVRHSKIFNFLQKIDIFGSSFIIFCTNLDKSFHIVSNKFMVYKSFRIFVFLNEATHTVLFHIKNGIFSKKSISRESGN
jgi:hypothetical protein